MSEALLIIPSTTLAMVSICTLIGVWLAAKYGGA